MAFSFLTAQGLKIEVTEGVDLESSTFLTGERVTVGSGAGDNLQLGSSSVVSEHLTFIRQPGAKTWEYFTSDRGRTAVDRGNPRTGTVRAGMWFRLGADTRIDVLRAPAPQTEDAGTDPAEKKEIPMAIALPIMGLMMLAFGMILFALNSDSKRSGASLKTAGWFVGRQAIEPSLDVCLNTGIEQSKSLLPVRVSKTAPDALFQEYIIVQDSDPARAGEVYEELTLSIKKDIAKAHFLANEKDYLQAADTLRRLENVLPVGTGKCPILSATRSDLATLEIADRRR